MSLQALAWAIEFQDLPRDERSGRIKSSCKLVLQALANHAGPEGGDCFPAVETIVYYTGLSERAVQYALRDMEDHGTIAKTKDPLVRASTIGRPDRQPESYDLVAFQRDPHFRGRGARSQNGVQDRGARGAESEIDSPVQVSTGCKVSRDLAPEPVLNQNQEPKSKSKDVATADAATVHAPDDDQPDLFGDVPVQGVEVGCGPPRQAEDRHEAEHPLCSEQACQDLDLERNDASSPEQPAESVQPRSADDLAAARRRRAAAGVAWSSAPPLDPDLDALWSAFWSVYPRKVKRLAARKAWDKAILLADPRDLVTAARCYAEQQADPWLKQWTKHPTTWLNAGCWSDEPELRPTRAGNGRGHVPYQQTSTDEDYLRNAATGAIF